MSSPKYLATSFHAKNKRKIVLTSKLFDFVLEMLRIGNRAVKKAQEKNRKLGIPNVYVKNGKIIYELANGKITSTNPF